MANSSASCTPFQYSPDGRKPIGRVQRMGSDYPLVQPSDDIQYLLADFFLSYEDPGDYGGTEYVLPFRIRYIYGLGCLTSTPPSGVSPSHDVDIIIEDANGVTVFDSTTGTVTYQKSTWSSRLDVYEWTKDSQVLRLVVHTEWPEDGTPSARHYDLHLVPAQAVLDSTTLHRQPKRIKKLIVNNIDITGDFEIEVGYNIRIQKPQENSIFQLESDDAIRNKASLEIAAIPGEGAGQYPGCGEIDIAIRTINGEGPNQYGDFILSPRDCVWYERPGTVYWDGARRITVDENTITLHDNCAPCCECQDYVEVKLAIDALYQKSKDLAKDAESIRDLLRDNIQRWNTYKACREQRPYKLMVVGSCGGLIGVAFGFCNLDKNCRGPLEVRFEAQLYRDGSTGSGSSSLFQIEEMPSYTRRSNPVTGQLEKYNLGGTAPIWYVYWDMLMGRSGVHTQFFLRACSSNDGDSVKIIATPTFDGKQYDPIEQVAAIEGECRTLDPCPGGSASA